MAQILADEDVPARLSAELRLLGHAVTMVRQIDSSKSGSGISDRGVLTYAMERSWIVLTLNERHFRRLHKDIGWHSGIVIVKPENDGKRLTRLAKCIDVKLKSADDVRGRLFTID